SVAYCHQQNGSAERTLGTLVSKTRCLMHESCMPDRYWPLAVKMAAFLYNLSPHSALNESSPFKTLFPQEKDIERGKEMHVFGSVAYRWIHHERRTRMNAAKFDPTSEKLVFVGYARDADAYLLLNPGTNQVIKERNLKVVDGMFPFCEKSHCTPCEVKCHCTAQVSATGGSNPVPELFVIRELPVYSSGGEVSEDGRVDDTQPEAITDSPSEGGVPATTSAEPDEQ